MAKLYFHYSTMNAGKSTLLLQASHNYRERGMHTMLFTAAFDDLWSLIALTDKARAAVQPENLFEGFWAGPETRTDWLNHPGSYQPPADWP